MERLRQKYNILLFHEGVPSARGLLIAGKRLDPRSPRVSDPTGHRKK